MSEPKEHIMDDEDEIDNEVAIEPISKLTGELISDEINDIISNKPHWMVRYGVSLIGIVSLLFLFIGWIVRYPDVVKASMNIVRSPENVFYGELAVQRTEYGKIVVGQDVTVRIENYPGEDFGYFQGKVTSISHSSGKEGRFLIHVTFPARLQTQFKFSNDIKASAEIIIRDRRLLEKLFLNNEKVK